MKIYESMTALIGHTPLVRLSRLAEGYGIDAEIIAKLEKNNPAGSSKDRAALEMTEDAEKRGALGKGSVIIEPTSGNTGIGLAAVAAVKGYKAIIVMPDTMSVERQLLMKAYGARVVLTPGELGMKGAIDEAERIKQSTPGAVIAGQFENPANPASHMKTTAPEIWEDTDGELDVLVAAVGTGGTITGCAEYLKGRNGNIKVIGCEPASSPLLSEGRSGAHKIQGIGANFVPEVLKTELIDEIITVTDEEAYEWARRAAKCEGLLIGISSGAALCAAAKAAQKEEYRGKRIVVILPDTGERYLSTEGFIQ